MEEQTNVLDQIDLMARQTEMMRLAQIRDKLDREYVNAYKLFGRRDLPDGLVVIERKTKYLKDGGQKPVYYRCVVGHHKTVGGMMAHIISAPSEEWPEEPTWQVDKWARCRWNYPDGELWTRKEPEYDYSVRWKDEGD